ncbi:kinase-like domain-containing protein [Aspergillus cavernicola]|uniref:Kinase-like domain-containing protein n=1 Tax=Aspergillus cavernicola TaxID=176166 RepID=A0ABR4IGF4_9EURO
MKFVSENTSIPVPKVYCSFVRKNRAYIVMERIQGEEVPSAWNRLTEDSRQKLFNELQRLMQELRALKPPKGAGVESCAGGSLRDSRIIRSCPRFGPFKAIHEFHLWLRNYLEPRGLHQCSTHGDLNPSNILVRGDRVTGIIDWEFSGWYPCYWEYTTAWLGNVTRTEWQDQLSKFLDPFPAELEMDRIRRRWWGDF